MAFQNLRTGSTVYIFHKDNSPKLEIGQVIAEPKIRQKYPIPTPGAALCWLYASTARASRRFVH